MLRKLNRLVITASTSTRRVSKPLILSLLSAVLLTLPFTYGNLWLLSWFGFLPLFTALQGKSKFQSFLFAFFSGIIFWLATIYWLIHVTLPGMILLVLYLALYFGFFGLAFSVFFSSAARCFILIPALWVLLEYLRSHILTGFGWALLGYAQYLNLPVIQIADITGAYGVSFLIIMMNLAIYLALPYHSLSPLRMRKYLIPALCMVFALTYGYHRLKTRPLTASSKPIKISLVQGNIPQELKWQTEYRDAVMHKYMSLSLMALRDNPDLIIWPEAALPVVLEEAPEFFKMIKDFVREFKTPLLFGVVTSRGELYYNSAILIPGRDYPLASYDKLHLVPFGEYIPLKKAFRFLEAIVPIGDIAPGREYAIFTFSSFLGSPIYKFSVLICFEDLFPELSRRFVARGAGFLVNMTNDAWFGNSPAPFQHFQASVFRAVENRVFLVRAANTGVSGFISPEGRIVSLVQDSHSRSTFIDGYVTGYIFPGKTRVTFYTQQGDIFIFACLLFFILHAVLVFLNRQKSISKNHV